MTKEVVLACIRSDSENVELLKEPYEMAMKKDSESREKDSESIKTLYQNKRCALFHSLTPGGDTVFHIAASMGRKHLLQDLFDMVPEESTRLEVLMMKDIHGNTLLHEAATSEDVEAAKFLVEKVNGEKRQMLMDQNKLGETPLYRAAALGTKAIVEYLADKVETEVGNLEGHFTRSYDNLSILHVAIMNEKFETAIWLLDKALDDLAMRKKSKQTALHFLASMSIAFKSSSGKMSGFKEFIYKHIPVNLSDGDETDKHVPSQCCEARKDHQPMTGLSMDRRGFWIKFWKFLDKKWPYIKKIREKRTKHELAAKLAKTLVKKDSSSWLKPCYIEEHNNIICFLRDKETVEKRDASSQTGDISTAVSTSDTPLETREALSQTGHISTAVSPSDTPLENRKALSQTGDISTAVSPSDTPLIIAASTGVLEIVEMIHKEYPQALEHVTENGQNILHVAILYRQYDIFKYVKEKGGAVNGRLILGIDKDGDTILHKAARTEYCRQGTKSTAALNLQEELKWFKDVESMVPDRYTIHRNTKNNTAVELFKDQHKEQLKNAQEWVKITCQSCSVVAVLVATVVFAAAFSVPGGFIGLDDDEPEKGQAGQAGQPVLGKKPLYSFFTVMDVTALASSMTSVVFFLSVLTSSLDQEEFLSTIPRRLTSGFTALFLAIAATVLSFTAALVLTVHLEKAWTTSLTYAVASLPVGVFAIVQFGLYIEYLKIAVISIFDFMKKHLPGI